MTPTDPTRPLSAEEEADMFGALDDALEAGLSATWDEADGMCPNCITPWKCNGPHLSEQTVAGRRNAERDDVDDVDAGGCITCYVVRSATYCGAHSPLPAPAPTPVDDLDVEALLDDIEMGPGDESHVMAVVQRFRARLAATKAGPS